MYGYLRIYSDELKLKQIRLYRMYYCALCTKLGEQVGIMYRFMTSYDITLFLIIFDCLAENDKISYSLKCPMKKMKNDIEISPIALQYSLLACIYGIQAKLNDDYIDETKHKFINRIINNNKIIKNLLDTDMVLKWKENMEKYYVCEKNENVSFDDCVNAIGHVYGCIFADYIDYAHIDADKNMMYMLGKNIGKYIYIMDAYDDYFDDLKKKRFNPIFKMQNYEEWNKDIKEIVKRVDFLLNIITNNIFDILHNIFITNNDQIEVIKNVLGFGTWKKYEIVTKKYNKKTDEV